MIDYAEYVRGWINYYKLADMKGLMTETDEWLRRRIRAIYWKQWKKVYFILLTWVTVVFARFTFRNNSPSMNGMMFASVLSALFLLLQNISASSAYLTNRCPLSMGSDRGGTSMPH